MLLIMITTNLQNCLGKYVFRKPFVEKNLNLNCSCFENNSREHYLNSKSKELI